MMPDDEEVTTIKWGRLRELFDAESDRVLRLEPLVDEVMADRASLLIALKVLIDAVESHDNPSDEGLSQSHASMNIARAAIAKAEGR